MTAEKKVLAWHFTDGMKLRDGSPLVVGKVYTHTGALVMCQSGYHASVDIIDALRYSPGWMLSRVKCSGKMKKGDDKMVCEKRKALWCFDAKAVIVEWAYRVATDAVKLVRKASKDTKWNAWADKWMSGGDRTANAAYVAAAYAAYATANAANAAYVATANAANAAYVAANAAYAADYAAAAYAPDYSADYAAVRKKARMKYGGWLVKMIEEGRKE